MHQLHSHLNTESHPPHLPPACLQVGSLQPPPAPSTSGNPRIFPVKNALKDFLAANPLEGTSLRERFTHLYNPKGGLAFLFSKSSLSDLFYIFLSGDGSCGVVSLSIALYGTDRHAPVLYQYLRRLFLLQNIF